MDWNVIQAPEIIGRLRRRLGLVQGHVTPTLNEGVQAVVILDDVSTVDAPGAPLGYHAGNQSVAVPAGCYAMVSLWGGIVPGNTLTARLRRVCISFSGAGQIQIIGGHARAGLVGFGFSSALPVPKNGAQPPGSAQFGCFESTPTVAQVATIEAGATPLGNFVDEYLEGNAVAGTCSWSRDYGSNGPCIGPALGQALVFIAHGSSSIPFSCYMEWEEFA